MRKTTLILTAMICVAIISGGALAQSNPDQAKDYSNSPLVTKMMAFDKKKDGKLTRDEITDSRLLRLFDQADANKDGVVTKEELTALAARLDAEVPPGRGGFGGPGGPPGGFGDDGFGPGPGGAGGGPPGGGPRGPGGPRGIGIFGGPPQPGQVLPPVFQRMLNLTDDQKKQVADLQKDVDARLEKILTSAQLKQMKKMRQRGPVRLGGGPGGPGPDADGGPPPPPPDGQ